MAPAVRSLSVRYADGHVIASHRHDWGQLVYAASGAIAVATCESEWLVPPARAVWLPPQARHRLQMRGAAWLRTIYLPSARAGALPETACGLEVSALLRELILHTACLGTVDDDAPHGERLAGLLVDLVAQAGSLPFRLRLPSDPRARRACALIRRNPAQVLSLPDQAIHAGASVRTLQRLFLRETGLHVAEWRRTARLSHAAMLLLDGASVTEAGLEAGYAGTSAFVSAFRRRTGMTPGAYGR